MKRTFRYDKDLECVVEVTEGSNYPKENWSPAGNLISDLEPYVATGIQDPDKGPGHPMVITGGRRQHRDELRARGLMEVGNDTSSYAETPKMAKADSQAREALARTGFYDGAATIRQLRRQQHR